MLSKRLIVCLDVREGKLAKSIKFVDTKDIGDPVLKARQYYMDGADELVFYDINASRANRDITLKFVEAVAAQIFIPFSVGGGIRSIEDATKLRLAGAEKVNVNSAAVKRKELISEISGAIGAEHGAFDGREKNDKDPGDSFRLRDCDQRRHTYDWNGRYRLGENR